MRNLLSGIIVFSVSFLSVFGQQNGVNIIEKKTARRHFIYAENTTEASRSVFLKVSAQGYRKSADRPIIKMVPPKTKVLMTTLIPLQNTEASYTYIFVADKEMNDIGVDRTKDPAQRPTLNELIANEVLIFTTTNCSKCETLISSLKTQRKKFREVNIKEKDWVYEYAWDYLTKKGYKMDVVALPMASVKGEIIQPIPNLKEFVKQLN